MNEKFGEDLTVGSIPKHLLTFSIPMLLGNALQKGYSIVNLIALASGATLATTILVS